MATSDILAIASAVLAAGGLLAEVRGLKRSVADQGRRLGSLKEEVDYNRGLRDGLEKGRREAQERAGAT